MIYTLTLNPSIDYMMNIDKLEINAVNRSQSEYILPGGKGINVSIVLNNLNIESCALGFIAGFTGREIENTLQQNKHLKTDFICLDQGMSRINVKINGQGETECNGSGPIVKLSDLDELYKQLNTLHQDDYLIISGSIPQSVRKDIYTEIVKIISRNNVPFIADTTGHQLLELLPYHPLLVKPNHHELTEMFHVKLSGVDDIIYYARKLKDQGAKNVIVSMASQGAILVTEKNEAYYANAPKGEVKNSVGAGDSLVAGFVSQFSQQKTIEHAFQYAIATGSASAFSYQLATKEGIELLYKDIKIEKK